MVTMFGEVIQNISDLMYDVYLVIYRFSSLLLMSLLLTL